MKSNKRFFLMLSGFFLAAIFALPNIALTIMFTLIYFHKYVCLLFCFMFAYNSGKLVQSKYKEYTEKNNERD